MTLQRSLLPLASLLAMLFVSIGIACGSEGSGSTPPERHSFDVPGAEADAIEDVFNRQNEAISAGNWQALYDTFSPAQHDACPYADFLSAIEGSAQSEPGFDITRFSVEDPGLRVEGDMAFATYVVKLDGEAAGRATVDEPDVLVRIDGKWYDELDTHSPFGC